MRRLRWAAGAVLLGALGLAFLGLGPARGQQILQYGFEAREPVWQQGGADAAFKEVLHRLTDETAHGGQRCEHIRVQAEKGSYIHYTYDLGRAPVTDELNVSLWIKSNRPNVQLLCRVVLPRERDPQNVGQPMTALLRCEPYQSTRWKLINLRQPVKRLREQQHLLQHQLGRDVLTSDAYLDRLVLNVYAGPGLTDVYIDDLEVGPVLDTRRDGPVGGPPEGPPAGRGAPGMTANRRVADVKLTSSGLLVSGQRFFLRGIRHTGTPLRTLRDAGFNTVWLDETTPAGVVEDAVNLGFWLVPTVTPPEPMNEGGGRVGGMLASNEEFARKVSRFLDQDAVLCWDLGANLTAERSGSILRTASAFRAADPMRPLAADVWDGLRSYSRGGDASLMLGVHRWPLHTSLELPSYRLWLTQRRHLAGPGTFCWTWIQTHLPDWFLQTAYGGGPEADGVRTAGLSTARPEEREPLGPQPEQIRLLAYTAIGCGYRGLGFWSDRFLADSHGGRDRLLALALLNQELQLLEPLLVQANEPTWIDTSLAAVQAAVIRTPGATLVLPVWMGPGSQYVPGGASLSELHVTVPMIPATAQAWEVSPGGVRGYPAERVLGGTKVKLRNFHLTSAIVFTTDLGQTGLVVRLQDMQRRMGRLAAQWAHDQAREELAKVEQVQALLEKGGHTVPDAGPLLESTRKALDRCVAHRRNGEHSDAYADAQAALQSLRILMRAHWDKAVRDLDTPVASPSGVSFYTLPRHWQLLDELKKLKPGANVLPDGDFELPPEKVPPGWLVQEVPSLDGAVPMARRVPLAGVKQGKQCLMLQLKAKNPLLSPEALERTFLAVHSPAVRLKPGTLVRITAWVTTAGVGASADGAMIYDSAGGEPLAVRVSSTKGWRRYCLFRRVPETGTINVTLALTGLGTAYFDDVRVEPLVPADSPRLAAAPPRPAPAALGAPAAPSGGAGR